jgi:hypothetical protein
MSDSTVLEPDTHRAARAVNLDLEHFRARVLQDALNEATVSYWLQRAKDLADVLSRPGDFTGHATPEQVAGRDAGIRLALLNIERHIALLREQTEISDEVCQALAEVA